MNAKLKVNYYLRMQWLGRSLDLHCHVLAGVSQTLVGGRWALVRT
jgi:hypothetical protein